MLPFIKIILKNHGSVKEIPNPLIGVSLITLSKVHMPQKKYQIRLIS